MMRTLLIVLSICLLNVIDAHSQENNITAENATKSNSLATDTLTLASSQLADSTIIAFLDAYKCGYYYTETNYIPTIVDLESLDIETMHKCIDCYINTKQYNEALELCSIFDRKLQVSGYEGEFDGQAGECCYYLSDYSNAIAYFDKYFSQYLPDNYYRALYADALYEEGFIERAEQYSKQFLDNIALEEGLAWDKLYESKNKKIIGSLLHQYAYIQMYKGDEAKGNEYLHLAEKCGNQEAWEDLNRLEANLTFNCDIKLKPKYIRQFDEYIRKYDIKTEVNSTDKIINDEYWNVLERESPSLRLLSTALARHKIPKTLARAINEISLGEKDMNNTLSLCAPQQKGKFEESLVGDLFGDDNSLTDFRIYNASEPNAFATPYGQIYLTSGIVRRFHADHNLLLGVCAHEATHFICQHSLISKWQEYEKVRRNNIWAGIAAGLYAASMVATSVYGAVNGARYDYNHYDNIARTTLDIVDAFRLDAYYFQFKYSREQEIESDIVAYRFCESMGVGGYAYIMALQMLGDNDLYMKADRTADHPTLTYRILLLKHLHDIDTGKCMLRTYPY